MGTSVYGFANVQTYRKIKMTWMTLNNWASSNVRAGPREIREVEDKLTTLLGQPFTEETIEQKKELVVKLNKLLEEDEQFWRQRSKENWIKLGDRNIRYFRQKANRWQRHNSLYGLMDDDGV